MTAHPVTFLRTSQPSSAKPSRISSLFASLLHEIEIRRALREVSALDDAAMHDIGLTPGNIEDVVRCGRH